MCFICTSPKYDIVSEIEVNKSIIKSKPSGDWKTIFYSVAYFSIVRNCFGDHIYKIIKCWTIIDISPKEATTYFTVWYIRFQWNIFIPKSVLQFLKSKVSVFSTLIVTIGMSSFSNVTITWFKLTIKAL